MNEEGHEDDSTDENVVDDVDVANNTTYSNQTEIHSDGVKSTKNISDIVKPDVEAMHSLQTNVTTAKNEPNEIDMNEGKETKVNASTSQLFQALVKKHMHGKYERLERGKV